MDLANVIRSIELIGRLVVDEDISVLLRELWSELKIIEVELNKDKES